jgi:hypothetical protein
MQDRAVPSVARFTATFPGRFAAALAEARGTIAGIAASAEGAGGGLIDAESLRRFHEIYRLRVELEIETASVLWRTAEVVSALADAIDLLSRRRTPAPAPPAPWLGTLGGVEVEARRDQATPLGTAPARRRATWPEFGGQEIERPGEVVPLRAWPPRPAERDRPAEAA